MVVRATRVLAGKCAGRGEVRSTRGGVGGGGGGRGCVGGWEGGNT